MRLPTATVRAGRREVQILAITGRGPGAILVLIVFLLLRPALKETVVVRRRQETGVQEALMVPVVAVFYFIIDDAIWPVFQSIAGAYALLYMALIGVAEMASVAQMVRMVSEGVEG